VISDVGYFDVKVVFSGNPLDLLEKNMSAGL